MPLLPLIEECLALMAPLAQERPVQLQLADRAARSTCLVRADPLRLKQVLLNLLSNAIKYNRRDGQVTVQGSRDLSSTSRCASSTPASA